MLIAPPRFPYPLHRLRFWAPPRFHPALPSPEELSRLSSITLGTQTYRLSDSLRLTSLPTRLKTLYPQLRIEVLISGQNPWVFLNHPHVDAWNHFPQAVFSETNEDRPEVYLTLPEIRAAKARIAAGPQSGKPLVALHPGKGEGWADAAHALLEVAEVWQVGLVGDTALPGVTPAFFPRSGPGLREFFAFMSRVRSFVGTDSAPLQAAKSQELPSLIIPRDAPVTAQTVREWWKTNSN